MTGQQRPWRRFVNSLDASGISPGTASSFFPFFRDRGSWQRMLLGRVSSMRESSVRAAFPRVKRPREKILDNTIILADVPQ